MFTAQDIHARLRQRPFAPMRIVTSSGEIYDVLHPEMMMVGKRDLTLGLASPDDPTTYEQVARVSLLHVTAMEDLPAARIPS